MAQLSNISIPARFTFRPFLAHWSLCRAEILGWWEKPIYGMASLIKGVSILGMEPPSLDAVKVRVVVFEQNIGSRMSAMLLAGLFGADESNSHLLKIDRTDVPPEVLEPHENPQNAEEIGGRWFDVFISRDGEANSPHFPFDRERGQVERNAWAMRQQFFDLECNVWDLGRFLNNWGIWSYGRGYESAVPGVSHPFLLIHPHRLWKQREIFRKALTGSPRAWLSSATPLTFSTIEKPPFFLVERFYCADAINATITIDHLGEVKFGICKRNDCRKMFERTTKQRRLYCSTECAHLANVRDSRKRLKKASSKSKGSKHNAKS